MVPGFEIEAPLFLGTSDTSLNLRFFRTKNGNGLHDRLGALGVRLWLSFLPALSAHLPLVILSTLAGVAPTQNSSTELGQGRLSGSFWNAAWATCGHGLTGCLLDPPPPLPPRGWVLGPPNYCLPVSRVTGWLGPDGVLARRHGADRPPCPLGSGPWSGTPGVLLSVWKSCPRRTRLDWIRSATEPHFLTSLRLHFRMRMLFLYL